MKRITKIETAKTLTLPKKRRVGAYARVSTSADEQLLSLEVQKSHYEDYIKSNPEWAFAGLYFDEGISGTKIKNRTGLQELLQDSEDGKIDLILTKSISRFARNTTECLQMVRRLSELGVTIIFEKENIDTSRMDNEFLLTVLASMAETESRSSSQNVKWAVRKRFESGTFIIPTPPYGYRNEDGEMVIVEEEAEVVRRIFSEALSGKGSTLIARGLENDGIPARKGKGWSHATVYDMLRNEKYTGDVQLQKTFTDDSFNRHYNHGEENMYLVKDHHAIASVLRQNLSRMLADTTDSRVDSIQKRLDGLADTIKPRLIEAGADCRNVAFIDDESLTLDDEQIRSSIADFNEEHLHPAIPMSQTDITPVWDMGMESGL